MNRKGPKHKAAKAAARATPPTGTQRVAEAIPLESAPLRAAPKGSRVGVVGPVEYDNDDALIAAALAGRSALAPSGADGPAIAGDRAASPAGEFYRDLLASFHFGGSASTALVVAALTSGAALSLMGAAWLPPMAKMLAAAAAAAMGAALLCLWWQTMLETAEGADELSWVNADRDWWDASVKPLLLLTVATALCFGPAWLLRGAGGPLAPFAGAAGLCVWPAMTLMAGVGGGLRFASPLTLLSVALRLGWAYWAVVALCGLTALPIVARQAVLDWVQPPFWADALALTPATVLIEGYLGFVTFRGLGLLWRHYRARFPWAY